MAKTFGCNTHRRWNGQRDAKAFDRILYVDISRRPVLQLRPPSEISRDKDGRPIEKSSKETGKIILWHESSMSGGLRILIKRQLLSRKDRLGSGPTQVPNMSVATREQQASTDV